MVDPKKEYELLMRYLQGGTLKQQPVTVPEQTYTESWQPTPQSSSTTRPGLVIPKKKSPVPVHSRRNEWSISGLGWKASSLVRRIRIITAVIAISLLVFFSWNGYSLYQLSAEKLFNQLYVPFAAVGEPVGKNSIGQYYTAGNYVAVTLQSKKQQWHTDREQLLTGLAYLHRGDCSKAIKWLEPAANNFKSPYRQQAEFYLALTYLKNEDYDRSIERMERMAHTPSHRYNQQITARVIRDIKMLKWK